MKASSFNIQQILKFLPHRYPMLLVDKILEIEPGVQITALKNVSINEAFFSGHFPKIPVMPGVLILEALAQTSALLNCLSFLEEEEINDSLYYLLGIDKARFRKIVLPGDQLHLIVKVDRKPVMNICKFIAKAMVNNVLVAEATLMSTKKQIEPV